MTKAAWIRVIPFMVFMLFIGAEDLMRFMADQDFISPQEDLLLYAYPVKAGVVGALLVILLPHCREIHLRDLLRWRNTLFSIISGLLIFWVWIHMTWDFATFGQSAGFPFTAYDEGLERTLMLAVRLASAVVVVPIMEELFWRSFLIRYLIRNDFSEVPIGHFTIGSFVISVILFGLEHNLYLAGMCAGLMFNLVLYQSRSIVQCILSHSVANLALGIYVIITKQWHFW